MMMSMQEYSYDITDLEIPTCRIKHLRLFFKWLTVASILMIILVSFVQLQSVPEKYSIPLHIPENTSDPLENLDILDDFLQYLNNSQILPEVIHTETDNKPTEQTLRELCHRLGFTNPESQSIWKSLMTSDNLPPSLPMYYCTMLEQCGKDAEGVTDSNNLCPCVPDTLDGKLEIDVHHLWETAWTDSSSLLPSLQPGGEWRPLGGEWRPLGGEWRPPGGCTPRRRVAVIIPYRDRERHLRAFLLHTHPILQRQLIHYRIFVVEQNLPYVFNKASLMNIGYVEAKKVFDMDCVLFHDVDTLIERDDNMVICGDQPIHFAAYSDRHGYKFNKRLFGSAVLLRKTIFEEVNGFSNLFFGWGGEDDDFKNRLSDKGYKVYRPPLQVGRCLLLNHTRDVLFEQRHFKDMNKLLFYMSRQKMWHKMDGLSSLRYHIAERTNTPLYTHILVDLKEPVSPKGYKKLPRYMEKIVARQTKSGFGTSVREYRVTEGMCLPVVTEEIPVYHVSRVTCRYLCDKDQWCNFIEYHPHSEKHSESYCRLLNECPATVKTDNTQVHIKLD